METLTQHLHRRNLDTKRPGVFVDENNRVASVLLYNLSGKIVGYQQYRPDADKKKKNHPKEGKYYTYISDEGCSKATAIYGIDTLDSTRGFMGFNSPVYVVEGIFDAAAIHWHGLPAIAVLQNDPKPLMNFLYVLGVPTVSLCDGDSAGSALAKFTDYNYKCPDGHDVSSLAESDWEKFCLWFGTIHNTVMAYKLKGIR